MIIGNGMLAKAFKSFMNSDEIIIFASGVSNSKEIKDEPFIREEKLLTNTIKDHKDKVIVYFSTCSIEDECQKDTKYVKHKIYMESLIEKNSNNFYIFRLPQVVGKTSSPTLINFLVKSINNKSLFEVHKNATRNLIDVDDVFLICNEIISNNIYLNEVTNIASPFNLKVIEIIKILENILDKKAIFKLVDKGCSQSINIDKINFIKQNIFKINYPEIILRKGVSL